MNNRLAAPSAARLLLVLLLSLLPLRLPAQSTGTGTITGFVTDASHAVMPGVAITITDLATGLQRSTVTNESGVYVVPALPVGTYSVKATISGFKTLIQSGVTVNAESRVTVNLRLDVGQVVESVSVTEAAPLVSTETGEVSTLVSGTQVLELALNGRNFTQFLALGPGVVSRQTGRQMGLGQEGNPLMGVHGGRFSMNKYTYDGTIAMDTGGNRGLDMFPPMEAIQEVKVLKSNYAADAGGYGYGVINIVTRRGGSSFHGDLYEFLRNHALDARNFFASEVSPLKLNNFGFALGGPFYIPGKYNQRREKDFFFVSESWAIRSGPQIDSFTAPPTSVFTATVPSAAMRAGDFTGVATIRDPDTGQVFPGNRIPPERIDPNARILMDRFIPLPNRSVPPNFVYSTNSKTDWREDLVRWDHEFTTNFRLTGRYAQDKWDQRQDIKRPGNQVFPTDPNTFLKPGKNLALKTTNILTPTIVNEFTFGFSMNRITNQAGPQASKPAELRIPEIFPANFHNVIPDLNFGSGFGGVGLGGQLNNVNPVYTYKDDFSFQARNHGMKAGVEIIRPQKFSTSYSNMQGSFTFNGTATGHTIADFLLGRAFQYTETEIQEKGYFFNTDYEFYLQDDWKVRPGLTLNLGLRYYIMQGGNGGYEKYDRISTFYPAAYDPARAPQVTRAGGELVPGTGDPLNGIITPGNLKGAGLPRSLKQTHPDTFGPRFGFAWSLPGGRTVVRGGYGMFYFWGANNNEGRQSNPPFSQSVSIFNTRLSNPAGGTARLFPPDVSSLDVANLAPTTQHWSLGVQRELVKDFMVELTYVGTRGTHLPRGLQLNQPRAGTVVSGVSANAVRPYLGYAGIGYNENSATSRYHSLEAHALRRFSGGFLFEASYTFSKALGDSEDAPQDTYNKRGDFGLLDLDRTHMLTLNYVYELPFYRHGRGWKAAVLGGWQLSGISTFQSGLPFSVTVSGDRAQVGGGTQRPNQVGRPHDGRGQSLDRYFNTDAFVLQPTGTFGNAARNAVRGPGINNWDFSVFKNLRPRERFRLQFGAELFNIFNHSQFEGVGGVLASATYGRVTTARDPRIMQLRAKLSF